VPSTNPPIFYLLILFGHYSKNHECSCLYILLIRSPYVQRFASTPCVWTPPNYITSLVNIRLSRWVFLNGGGHLQLQQ
jgi:hypothetical protein